MDTTPNWIMGGGGAALLGGLSIAATVDRSDATGKVLFVVGLIIAGAGVVGMLVGLILHIRASRRTAGEPVLSELSSAELKAYAARLAQKLREFQKKYNNATARQTTRRMTEDKLTEEERSRRFWDRARADEVERNTLMVEFGPLRVRAKATRDEILKRLGRPQPRPGDRHLSIHEEGAAILLEYGGFSGAHPADALADYLEGIALEMPSSGPFRGA